MQRSFTLLLLVALGCGSGDSGNGVLKPPADPTVGTSSTTDAPTTDDGTVIDTDGAACSADAACNNGLFCSAPSAGGPAVGAGEYTCSDACVADNDPTRWCFDDMSCCGMRTCSNGLCLGPSATMTDPGTSTDDGSSGDSGTGDGTSTGDVDSSSSGSDSGSSG